jgi:transposase-like protein
MTKRLSNEKKKQYAEEYYVNHGMTYEEISDRLDVSMPTLSKWSNDSNPTWKEKRAKIITNPVKLQQLFLEEAERVAKGETPTINADALLKLVKASNDVVNTISPSIIFSVLKECDLFIANADPVMAKSIAQCHKMFLLHKIEEEA